jgi:hypothetical protein
LLDRPSWPVALSGFSRSSVVVAVHDGSNLAELVALGDPLSRFQVIDLFFTGDTGSNIGADLIDLYRSHSLESSEFLDDLEAMAILCYRTFGYGYMLHRRSEGHTWDADVDHVFEQSEDQWRGLSQHVALVDR